MFMTKVSHDSPKSLQFYFLYVFNYIIYINYIIQNPKSI